MASSRIRAAAVLRRAFSCSRRIFAELVDHEFNGLVTLQRPAKEPFDVMYKAEVCLNRSFVSEYLPAEQPGIGHAHGDRVSIAGRCDLPS